MSERKRQLGINVLIVSPDIDFIAHASSVARAHGSEAIGCIGPLAGKCPLFEGEKCPLMEGTRLVIVHSESGVFSAHGDGLTIGEYAEELRAMHPGPMVVVSGPSGLSGIYSAGRVHSEKEALSFLGGITGAPRKRSLTRS